MGRAHIACTLGIGILALLIAVPASAQEPEPTPEATESSEANPSVLLKIAVQGEGSRDTDLGSITIELFPEDAPQHVANFVQLVQEGFYVGISFHRIVPGFVIQGGDPASKADWTSPRLGLGVDDCQVPAEIARRHLKGAVAAARKPDEVNPKRSSSCHQFYICLADLPSLDRGNYTVFGQVTAGMEVVEKVSRVKNAGSENWHRALQRVYIKSAQYLE